MRMAAAIATAVLAACSAADTEHATAQAGTPERRISAATINDQPPNARSQTPTFAGQTRAPAVRSGVTLEATVVVSGLDHPWGLEFLGDGRMLVTEQEGRLRVVTPEGKLLAPVTGVPKVLARGQGGLLDVAVRPSASSGGELVCLSYAEPRSDGNGTSAACGRAVNAAGGNIALEGMKVVFRQRPSWDGTHHFGSRIVFTPDDRMFIALGERNTGRSDDKNTQMMAQKTDNSFGSVVRINTDGSVPADNPFAGEGSGTQAAQIWDFGHRNIQSAAIDPATGELWTVEHGPMGGDELNLIRKGANYGWPAISYGIDYSGEPVTGGDTTRKGMEQPVYFWDPVIAPSGMLFYTGDLFPDWKGNLLVGGLATQQLVRLVMRDGRVAGEERFDIGARVRDVRQGADGAIYIVTDEDDGKVIRLTPAA